MQCIFFIFILRFTLFVIFLPLIQTVLFNVACGHDPKHLSLGILNEEYVDNIGKCSLEQTNSCFLNESVPVSCLVLEKLREKTFDLVICTDIFDIVTVILF